MQKKTKNRTLIFAVVACVVLTLVFIMNCGNKSKTDIKKEVVTSESIEQRIKKKIAEKTPANSRSIEVFVPDEIMQSKIKPYPGCRVEVLIKNNIGSEKRFTSLVSAILGNTETQKELSFILLVTPEQADDIEAAKKSGSISLYPQNPLPIKQI